MGNVFKIKNFSDSYLYHTKINKNAKDNPGEIANKELMNFILTSHRVDKSNSLAFGGVVEDVKRQQTSAILTDILLSNKVVLCIGNAPLPRAFAVFEAKDPKDNKSPNVFIDLTGRIEYKDGFYIIRRGMVDQVCALLFEALVYLMYRRQQNKLMNNNALTLAATESYVLMFDYVIDYLRILGFSQNKSKISYTVAIFFLTSLMNYEPDDNYMKSIAAKIAGLNTREISAYDLYLQDIDFTNINTFLITMTATFNLRGLDLPSFVSKWMYLYGTGTEYAIELYTSFVSLLCVSYTACYMVNWSRIEKCCTSANITKVATSVLKAANESMNRAIFNDATDSSREVHSKNSAELAESMKLKNSIRQSDFYVKESDFSSINTAKDSAKNIVETCKKAILTDKLNVFAERSLGSGISAAYNACVDLLEGKIDVENSPYEIGALEEVAKVFKNQFTDTQRYSIKTTIDRDTSHLHELTHEAGAPNDVNKTVAKTIMEFREILKYI